ncbi:MerR family transcriptional regulator, partial [Streptomyces sp. NPDC055078]
MRIGELSRRTGVPVPTIKYYVREGLLPAGRLTSPNQATYDESHERRLRLIRAMLDVGGLKVAAIADVLAAVDDPGRSVHKVLGVASELLVQRFPPAGLDPELGEARERVVALIADRGWRVDPDCAAVDSLATALATLERLGQGDFAEVLDDYAAVAEQIARADLRYAAAKQGREALVEGVIVGTVVGDAMLDALRHLAQVDRSARVYGGGVGE